MVDMRLKEKYISQTSQIAFSPKEWERFKKNCDKELYKKHNKYADYSELRISIDSDYKKEIRIESHIIKEVENVSSKD